MQFYFSTWQLKKLTKYNAAVSLSLIFTFVCFSAQRGKSSLSLHSLSLFYTTNLFSNFLLPRHWTNEENVLRKSALFAVIKTTQFLNTRSTFNSSINAITIKLHLTGWSVIIIIWTLNESQGITFCNKTEIKKCIFMIMSHGSDRLKSILIKAHYYLIASAILSSNSRAINGLCLRWILNVIIFMFK